MTTLYIYICIYQYIYRYNIYIMKAVCPPEYHDNSFVATHVLGHMRNEKH